jgi:RND superfamily putative drug exporter
MDYEVFLVSRIREAYVATGDNAEAVARGLAATGRVITCGALIMMAVFLSFVANPNPFVKMIGLGSPSRSRSTRPWCGWSSSRDDGAARPRELVASDWLDRVLPQVNVEEHAASSAFAAPRSPGGAPAPRREPPDVRPGAASTGGVRAHGG